MLSGILLYVFVNLSVLPVFLSLPPISELHGPLQLFID